MAGYLEKIQRERLRARRRRRVFRVTLCTLLVLSLGLFYDTWADLKRTQANGELLGLCLKAQVLVWSPVDCPIQLKRDSIEDLREYESRWASDRYREARDRILARSDARIELAARLEEARARIRRHVYSGYQAPAGALVQARELARKARAMDEEANYWKNGFNSI
ncbi:MAG: hypothetical protein ACLFOY_08125 [Desulfatibacillaceae bacterium]